MKFHEIGVLNHVGFRTAIYPILNYLEFRTNHAPYVVHGVVHNSWRRAPCKVHGSHEPYVVRGGERGQLRLISSVG